MDNLFNAALLSNVTCHGNALIINVLQERNRPLV